MVLLPLAAVVVAFVGHPIPVTCADLPPNVLGTTTFINGRPTRIVLSTTTCDEWRAVQRDPSWETLDRLAGGALSVAVHEAEHARYDATDEALTQCRALRDYGRALDLAFGRSQYAGVDLLRLEFIYGAGWLDQRGPAGYHGAVC